MFSNLLFRLLRWLKFDLFSNSKMLASYECSEAETYQLIQTALSEKAEDKDDQSDLRIQFTDILLAFAENCKISQSEALNKWYITLDNEQLEQIDDTTASNVADQKLDLVAFNDSLLNSLKASVLIDLETMLDCNSPASARSSSRSCSHSRGSKRSKSNDSMEEVKEEKEKPATSSFLAAASAASFGDNFLNFRDLSKKSKSKRGHTNQVLTLRMRPPTVKLIKKIGKKRTATKSKGSSCFFSCANDMLSEDSVSDGSDDGGNPISDFSLLSLQPTAAAAEKKEEVKKPLLKTIISESICLARA